MRQSLAAAFLSVLALVWAPPALADPITILTNSTGIAAQTYVAERGVIRNETYPFTVNGNNAVTVSDAIGGTTATASASITSDLTDLSRVQSSGSTHVAYATQTGEAEGISHASFFVAFQLAMPHEYRFAADFLTSGDATMGPPALWSEWGFDLMSLDPWRSHEPALMIERGHNSTTLVRSGLLAPGYYRFNVQGTTRAASLSAVGPTSGSAFSNFGFSLGLTASDAPPAPTPEPASLLLIGTGLGALLAVRRRTRDR